MPELPEVETLVRRLREPMIGHTIEDVTIYWKRTVARPAPKEFARLLRGCTVQAIDRRAKYLVFTLGPRASTQRRFAHALSDAEHQGGAGRRAAPPLFLLIHLKMSGKLSVVEQDAPIEKHDRVVFALDNSQQLRFNDVRKFGKMWLVADSGTVTGALGPEPLDKALTLPKFRTLVKSRSGAIKPLLLNQEFLAGVGNIYADESLWLAKIHPLRQADSLQDAEIDALYRSIRRVLRTAIRDEGTDAGDGVIEGDYQPRVYGRTDRPCYRCHRPIHRIVVGQRGTHFCPHCQSKRGRLDLP
ncbi:MAG TPA: bifunctional DNA-formamidopyrimidine glycosylase/DNA-(apurinic or apyrimidinic site) lyase [Anaerolineae bacterium]|nr:bifunctional DNA-formamidopyrimidine glycosylase/DNA-(apurinic or apyrimidinic site) lyase [Anaerolineae bacterium]